MKPKTQYAKSGKLSIAFQVIGKGPIDLIYVPGWVSNIDNLWDDSKMSEFLIKLTNFSRLILFDKEVRGFPIEKMNFQHLRSEWMIFEM